MSVTLDRGLVPRESLDRKTDTSLPPEGHLLVKEGDIAYNMMRMWQGASGLSACDALVSPAYVVLEPTSSVDPLFGSYFLKSARALYLLWAYSYGLTDDRLRLYFDDFALIPVTVPPTVEQRWIGGALRTWDRAIETVERLIDNAERQKAALAQQLLPGKRRLSKSPQHWRTLELEELADIQYGKSPNGVLCETGKYPVIGTGGVTGRSNVALCQGPSIVLGRKGTIDKPIYLAEPFWPIDTTFFCLPRDGCDIRWLYHVLASAKLAQYSEASGVPSLSRGSLYSIKFSVPPLQEQRQIASVLDSADKELEVRKLQRMCLLDEKRALMQQLLTGKRRVRLDDSRERAAVA